MRLFEHPLSPYSQKVKICMYEKGLSFESRMPFLQPDEEFMRVSPLREIPVLVDGENIVTNSPFIIQYLEEKMPDLSPVMPKDLGLRTQARILQNVCDTQLDAAIYGVTEVTAFERGTEKQKQQLFAAGRRDIFGFYSYFSKVIGEKPYLLGANPTVADFALFPQVSNALKLGFDLSNFPVINAWYANIIQRESVRRAAAEADAAEATFQDTVKKINSAEAKRLYRDHRLEWIVKNGGIDIVIDGVKRNNIRFSTRIT